MAEYTAKQLVDAARRAEAAGDTAAAQRLKAKAREAVSYDDLMRAAREADRRGEVADARRLLAFAAAKQQKAATPARTPGSTAFDTAADFARGTAQGLRNMSQAGQKLLWHGLDAVGAVDEETAADMLSIVNHRQASQQAELAPSRERSPFATGAGEFVGEALFTAPIGGAGGAVAKGGFNAARAAATGRAMTGEALRRGGLTAGGAALAGEGAALGAYASGGENVAGNAAQGAMTNLAAGTAINALTRGAGAFVRDRMRLRRARGEVDSQLGGARQRIQDAREDGGYQLDGATALASQRGHDELSRLSADNVTGQQLRNHRAQVEQDIELRARDVAGSYGPVPDGRDAMKAQAEGAVIPAQRTLAALKLMDERQYKRAYAEFDSLAKESRTFIDTSRLGPAMKTLKDRRMNSALESTIRKVDKDLERFGIGLEDIGQQRKAAKPLTLENVEDMVAALNAQWSPAIAGTAKWNYIKEVKKTLTDYVDSALQEVGQRAGIGAEVYEAGKRAREARKAFSESWERKDIVAKLAERTADKEFKVDYARAIAELSKGGAKDLQMVKAKLLTARNGNQAWKSLQAAPLLEALYAATKDSAETVMEGGVIRFKEKEFERVINSTLRTQEAKAALWGAEEAERISRMLAAWKQRYRRPDTSGSSNPSGTASTLLKSARYLPGSLGREFLEAVPVVGRMLERSGREESTRAILKGGVPENVTEEMTADLLSQWEEAYVGADGLRYGNMLRQLMRGGVVIEFTDEG